MKVKCKMNFVIAGKAVCSKGEVVDVEQFDASWFEDGRPWIHPIDENLYRYGHRVNARGYGLKRGWLEIRLYDGEDAARHYNGIDFNDYFETTEMPLTAENVELIHNDCLGDKSCVGTDYYEGIKNGYCYDKTKVNKHALEIEQMLMQLPKQFRYSVGGGYSFLHMCMREDGVQWTGLHVTMEKLLCLGLAVGKLTYLLPKKMWDILPASMPYIIIRDK